MGEEGTSAQDIIERYGIDHTKRFGEGGYGATFAAKDRKTGEDCVVKVIDTRKMKVHLIKKECDFLEKVRGHKNVINMYNHTLGVAKHSHLYFIFMEKASGGELFDQLSTHGGPVPERLTLQYVVGLANAIHHCHQCGVAHRDIKLENVLLNNEGDVKLIDFGLSHQYPVTNGQVDKSQPIQGFCGSKSYAAAEVLHGRGYDGFVADMWSLGVCVFGLLNGFFPVDEAKVTDWRFKKLKQAQDTGNKDSVKVILSWYRRDAKHLSPEAVDLMNQLLRIDPSERPTIGAVLHHPWITGGKLLDPQEQDEMAFRSLSNYPGSSNEELHYRGSGGVFSSSMVDDMEIEAEGPVYRSFASMAALEDDEDESPMEMPMMARQAAFGGQESSFGDIFAF